MFTVSELYFGFELKYSLTMLKSADFKPGDRFWVPEWGDFLYPSWYFCFYAAWQLLQKPHT